MLPQEAGMVPVMALLLKVLKKDQNQKKEED